MIDPPPPAIISGSAARLSRNDAGQVDRRRTVCHSARLVSSDGAARVVRRGAADQDIEPAERVAAPRAAAARVSASLATLQCRAEARPPAARDQPRGFRRRRRIDVAAGDGGAGLGKGDRDRPADAAAGAADQRRLAGQMLGLTASPCRHRRRWSAR